MQEAAVPEVAERDCFQRRLREEIARSERYGDRFSWYCLMPPPLLATRRTGA